ncbi:SAM-dependent methyltransferase [Rhodococcus daqingensis]|uniref:SAM-dependent methyltransferase n=1 Tax=Rhodococcus daqingensis TaxID=2479363 RepID=A0ABW2RZP2_9NOCA
MTSTPTTDELAERLFSAVVDTLEVASVHLGARLGFYRALADAGDATAGELAARTGTVSRCVREWLEQQAVAGLLSVDEPDAPADLRRYRIPTAHLPVLVDQDDLRYLTPLASLAIGVVKPDDAIVHAFRTGTGVPYEAYQVHTEIGAINRPQFVNLVTDWLGSVPEIDLRLRRPDARVADIACGTAWSSIAIAQAYPETTIDALDVDAASIQAALANVAATGLTDRVRPIVQDAANPDLPGPYDLVTIFEALHDMSHPVEALRAARASLADGGSVLVADERVAERFTAPCDEIERLNYGWSILHCLLVGMTDPGSAATGTVIRPATVCDYAAQAGFTRTDILTIEHEFWRFYRLVP